MKTLNHHVILYDNECPMCDLYTGAFVKTGMLDQNGRVAFTEANTLINQYQVDRARACDQIALIDTKTGTVNYGVDSLMHILENRFRFLAPLFDNKVFRFVIGKIYFFISFNRKVIIPGRDMENVHACRPSFNLKYRIFYLVFTWLITSFVLATYADHLQPFIPPTNFYREFLICGGQIIFQGTLMMIVNRKKMFEYLGNMMTISFAGALLLVIALACSAFITDPAIYAGYFALTVCLMFLEHFRRMKIVGLPWIMTFTWVVYRILILAFLI